MRTRIILVLATVALTNGWLSIGLDQPKPIAPGEWPAYHRDLASTRYSPLDAITRANVASLAVAWTWKSESTGQTPPEFNNETTPIMVDGVLYFATGATRTVVAADAATGATKWTWHLDEGARAAKAPRRDSGRGVSYWTDGSSARIFMVTPGFQLVALDAKSGTPVESFGEHGVVDLKMQLGVPVDVNTAAIGNSSPPLVFENVVVIGPALEVGIRPPSFKNVPGRILAIDAKTGALKWRFNTIPQKGEFGNETWDNGSAEYTGNAGAWAPLTLDTSRGYLYLPVEAATGDYYGGHRHGDNLFSSTLVCLDVRTGKRVWHYQLVHHDIWDRDIPAAPILATVNVGGRRVDVVAQITKQAFLYVFDRTNGQPIWPIIEQPMPASDVPDEKASATQPIPSKPKAFDRQTLADADLIDFTPELHAEALAAIKNFRTGGPFQPPSLVDAADGTKGALVAPGNLGGGNWEGGALDPDTGILYVGSWTNPSVFAMSKDPQRSDMNYVGGAGQVPRVRGLPIVKPPYSRVTAINLNTGDHVWMAANGDTPAAIKNNPALAGLTIPKTGAQARPFVMATKTLLFVGEGNRAQPFLHVLDKATGATIADIQVPGSITSSPMTFAIGGKQFVAFWVADQATRTPSQLIALAVKN